ncbi:DUF5924 family protein [Paraliomyxa miuraensis]|uniref:DUF5924 family protein n=1 Tax=Paraliomyxa miuraensis TaxID=376150 RepID=UPI0022552EC4|nr:DUF5924 family protein [Paraliomyxa miuraensis]MCX4239700.1 DUF2914 domain-containing protein [Paraliomyxa miuraensis]
MARGSPSPDAPSGEPSSEAAPEPPKRGIRAFFVRYGRMLWWFHSFYALGLGIFIIIFAQKGFSHARWLSISLAGAWMLLLLFFRLFGSGKTRALEGRGAKLRFFVMTYVLKNLYQGMLFFLLPFYWRSATLDTPNQWFVVALAACAFLSTLDVVFDQVLMRWKVAASLFYFVTLFACLNLVIPALLPNSRSLVTMTAAAAISAIAFWMMHVPTRWLARPAVVGIFVVWTMGAVIGVYFGRAGVPPVAMYVSHGAVGPSLLPDGRLAIEASKLHQSLIHELHAVTDVVVPGGKGDRLEHVWTHEGQEVSRVTEVDPRAQGPTGTIRLRSQLPQDALPAEPAGAWTVDVVTQDGQLVGRAAFEITQ